MLSHGKMDKTLFIDRTRDTELNLQENNYNRLAELTHDDI